MAKLKVGILGATGMVGQRFLALLERHPWFEVVCVAASPNSAGKPYEESVRGRWKIKDKMPNNAKKLAVKRVEEDIDEICGEVDFVFSALDMDKQKICEIEENYASRGIPVVSNNSVHRWTEDVPMIIPEINPEHVKLIDIQRKKRSWKKGFIAVKPNCSIQSYVPIIKALEKFQPSKLAVTTLQAVSGAGRNLAGWPEMNENVIPFISKEEEKSEREPLKILGKIRNGKLSLAKGPEISATCIRVPVEDGHMASVEMKLNKKISREKFIDTIGNFNPIAKLRLPSSPKQFIRYFDDENRPQTRLDRDFGNGMGISVGRLREDKLFGWKFVALSHNTVRGAAGGAILLAELLKAKGYLQN
ncbi:aspartate-semialdehyde dehydrogenase [Candidatus Woesearchaeota archaeon]|nr:aspartate-semialdehyde dehydrogenase [Candidatus Woesearchaeota archaeon]